MPFKEYLEKFRFWLLDAGFSQTQNENLEKWDGSLSVDWTDPKGNIWITSRHSIGIILPKSFPYKAPVVISRDDPPLKPSFHLNPANSDRAASLCLWLAKDWKPYFTAQKLLNRVKDWFVHYHQNDWPDNSSFPDLYRYLEPNETVILTEAWEPDISKKKGIFYLAKPNRDSLKNLAICSGNHSPANKDTQFRKQLLDALYFPEEKKQIRYRGAWFWLGEPIVPQNSLFLLLKEISEKIGPNFEMVKENLTSTFGVKITQEICPIAFGYSEKTGEKRWVFLSFNPTQKKIWNNDDLLKQQKVISYFTASARKKDLLRRVGEQSDLLATKKVCIFGVGCLGSTVAILHAKAGVGSLKIVDSERLYPGNVIRHECGMGYVSYKKANALKLKILQHNPHSNVEIFDETWDKDKIKNIIQKHYPGL